MFMTAHLDATSGHSCFLQTSMVHKHYTWAHMAEVLIKVPEEWKLTVKDPGVVINIRVKTTVAIAGAVIQLGTRQIHVCKYCISCCMYHIFVNQWWPPLMTSNVDVAILRKPEHSRTCFSLNHHKCTRFNNLKLHFTAVGGEIKVYSSKKRKMH